MSDPREVVLSFCRDARAVVSKNGKYWGIEIGPRKAAQDYINPGLTFPTEHAAWKAGADELVRLHRKEPNR